MKSKLLSLVTMAVLLTIVFGCTPSQQCQWKMHDKNRPQPTIVESGEPGTQQTSGRAPSDAIVLFDGTDLSKWEKDDGSEPKWKVENGYMEVVGKTGSIQTIQSFGSCQLHIEWAAPAKITKKNGEILKGQDRGNSGVFMMTKYEVQVLDSYGNTTYPDGQAAALYGQSPPMVNACRPPGQWQSYDIIFHRPIFKGDKLVKPSTFTVLHNGILVQDNFALEGTSSHSKKPKYEPHPDKLPLSVQDHKDPVRYRNIWIRELEE